MVQKCTSLGSYSKLVNFPGNQLKRALEAELVLGVASRNCQGNGICSLYTKGRLGLEKNYCHFSEVTIKKDDREALHFFFKKESMRKSTYQKHFESEYFVVEESVELPVFVRRQLGLNRSFLAAGKYPILESDQFVAVRFPREKPL